MAKMEGTNDAAIASDKVPKQIAGFINCALVLQIAVLHVLVLKFQRICLKQLVCETLLNQTS